MNFQGIGNLEPHPDVPEWLVSAPIPIPLFDGLPLTFTLEAIEGKDAPEVATAIASFLRLGPESRSAASPYVYDNYKFIAESADEEDLGFRINSADEVWEHVYPTDIHVSRRRRRDKAIYVQVAAECDWDLEHALQLVYRRGFELSRVSDQDGHLTHTDAYDLPEDQDRIA